MKEDVRMKLNPG